MTSLVSRFAHQGSEEPREPRRTTGRSSLPAPLPGWPEMSPKALPIPAGGDRFFCPFLALLAVEVDGRLEDELHADPVGFGDGADAHILEFAGAAKAGEISGEERPPGVTERLGFLGGLLLAPNSREQEQ